MTRNYGKWSGALSICSYLRPIFNLFINLAPNFPFFQIKYIEQKLKYFKFLFLSWLKIISWLDIINNLYLK